MRRFALFTYVIAVTMALSSSAGKASTPALPSCSYYRDGTALNLIGHLVTKTLCRSLNRQFVGAGGGRAVGQLGCGWRYGTGDQLVLTITARRTVSAALLRATCARVRPGRGWFRFR
jgi:hypothetical protein